MLHVDSYYQASASTAPAYAPLEGIQQADVCVIGAGLTGISAALELAQRGYRVTLLEARQIAWGASGRAGGQLIVGYGASPASMERLMSPEDARRAFAISVEGLALVKQRIREHAIDCDLVSGQAEVAARAGHMDEFREMQEQLARDYNYELQLWDKQQLAEQLSSQEYHGAWFDPAGGHLHPLNYTLGLAAAAARAGVNLHEDSAVEAIEQGNRVKVKTARAEVHCTQVILAANAYLDGLLPAAARRILPVGSYICATELLGETAGELIRNNMAVADSKHLTSYYRLSADGRLLFGGRTGLTQRQPANLQQVMLKRISRVFPQLQAPRIEYQWGGNIAVTMNRMPDIGRMEGNLYYAHGFSGHGLVMANMAGKLMAEAIAGDSEKFDVFGRISHRAYPGGTLFRAPGLALAMLYFALRDVTG